MTRIKIPECSNPFEVTVNGRKYKYKAGIETDVPDEVAVIIEKHNKAHYKEAPETVAPFGAISFNDLKHRPFYEEVKEVTVVTTEDEHEPILDGFPVFKVGDTVNVTVDGTEYSLVAYDDEYCVAIGDTSTDIDNSEGSLGWQIYVNEREFIGFYSLSLHTITYNAVTVKPLDEKYIPDSEIVITISYEDKSAAILKGSYDDVYNAIVLKKRPNVILYATFTEDGVEYKDTSYLGGSTLDSNGIIELYFWQWQNVIRIILTKDSVEYGYSANFSQMWDPNF